MCGTGVYQLNLLNNRMQNLKIFLFSIVSLIIISCEQDNISPEGSDAVTMTLPGTWQLYERGYSPGAGYITDPVSTIPSQEISLQENGRFSSNIEGLENFLFYAVLNDGFDNEILALFTKIPGADDLKIENLEHSYMVNFEKNILKLHYRWCIEGCHLGFRPLDDHR